MALLKHAPDLMSALRAAAEGSEVLDWGILCQFGNPTWDIHTCPPHLWRHVERHQVRPQPFTTSLQHSLLIMPQADNLEVRISLQRDLAQVEAVRLIERKDGVDERLIHSISEWRPAALNVATMAMELRQKGW